MDPTKNHKDIMKIPILTRAGIVLLEETFHDMMERRSSSPVLGKMGSCDLNPNTEILTSFMEDEIEEAIYSDAENLGISL